MTKTSKKINSKTLSQPPVFIPIFFLEMWERFSFYGIQFLLILFMTKTLNIERNLALTQQGAFISLVYISPILGGWLADKIFGIKRTLITGAFLLAFGYMILSIAAQIITNGNMSHLHQLFFYIGLGMIIAGNGCFKPNSTSLLSKAYKAKDPRMDRGFTLFYLSINIGSISAITLIPIIAANYGYAEAFALCSLGLFIGLANFFRSWNLFAELGSDPDFDPLHYLQKVGIIFILIIMSILAGDLLLHVAIADYLINFLVIIISTVLVFLSFTVEKKEAQKMRACLMLTALSIIFWTIYNSMFGLITLFVQNHVDRHIFGYEIPTENFAIFNPLAILLFGPIINKFYDFLTTKKINFTLALKFSFGILIAGCSMFSLSILYFVTNTGIVSTYWVIPVYALIGIGELLVGAIGLSMVAQLAPQKYLSFMYSSWLLAIALGGWLSGQLGYFLTPISANTINLPNAKFLSFISYLHVFTKLGFIAILAAIIAMLLAPYLSRQTGELD